MKYHDDYPYDDSDDFQDLDMDTDDYFDDIDFDYDEREAFVAPQRERRVPRTEVEEPYEDEIDRMRRRGRRSGSRQKKSGVRQADASYSRQAEDYRGSRQNPSHSRKNRKSSKKTGKIFFGILLAIAVIAGILFVQRWWKLRDGYWNIAVFGVDSRGGGLEKGALSDVEIICSINKKTNEIRLVSVYRDTYLQIDSDGSFDKINEAYFLGGHEQAIKALERNLDIQIDDYATFNWKAVADAINLLGGIDLEITDKEFYYINSFITETVESTGVGSYHLEHAGMNHLDGVQAVAYCRLRLMDTDFNRTERQRKVIMLALEKAKQADISVLTNIVVGVLPQLSTSVGPEDLMPIAKNITKYEIGQTAGFPFAKTTTRVGKLDCVIPMTLESNVAALHQFLYGQDAAYIISPAVREISNKIAQTTGIYEEGEIPGFIYNPPDKGSDGQGAGSSQNNQSPQPPTPVVEETASPEPAPIVEETTAAETSEEESESETEESETETESTDGEESDGERIPGPSVEDIDEDETVSPPPSGPSDTIGNPGTGGSSSPGTGPSPNGPTSPEIPEPEGPGAGLPAPDTSENNVGIIHSGPEIS